MLKLIAAGVALACALLLVAVDGSYYQQGGYGSAYNPYSESRYPSLLPEAAAYAGGAPLPPNAKYNELVPYLKQFARQYFPRSRFQTVSFVSDTGKTYMVEWYSTGQPTNTYFAITANLADLTNRNVFSLHLGFTYNAFDLTPPTVSLNDNSVPLRAGNTFTCRYVNGVSSFLYRPNANQGGTFDPLKEFYKNETDFFVNSPQMTFTNTTVTCSFVRVNGVPVCPPGAICDFTDWRSIVNGQRVYFFASTNPCSGQCLVDTDLSTNIGLQSNTTVRYFNYSMVGSNC